MDNQPHGSNAVLMKWHRNRTVSSSSAQNKRNARMPGAAKSGRDVNQSPFVTYSSHLRVFQSSENSIGFPTTRPSGIYTPKIATQPHDLGKAASPSIFGILPHLQAARQVDLDLQQ